MDVDNIFQLTEAIRFKIADPESNSQIVYLLSLVMSSAASLFLSRIRFRIFPTRGGNHIILQLQQAGGRAKLPLVGLVSENFVHR